jgi:ribosomal protein L11 methyltransferase
MTKPYDILHIYYIEGTLSYEDEMSLCSSFIGNWEDDGFSFLFFKDKSDESVDELFKKRSDLKLVDTYEMSYSDWLGDVPVPFAVGNYFVHAPFHELKHKIDTNKNEIRILLDPGVVFGTGRHPTTYNCLELVERALRENNIDSVLDIGTGTGLLAIAAAIKDLKYVIAMDYNFLATKTTLKNVALNKLDNVLVARGCGIGFMDYEADLVVANIHYDIMKDLIVTEGFFKKRFFILSGIFKGQAQKILDKINTYDVNIIDHRIDNEWHTIYGENIRS